MAVVDQVEALRSEEDVDGDLPEQKDVYVNGAEPTDESHTARNKSNKYVATVKQVHEAFDTFTTLRYSQPTHLQGWSIIKIFKVILSFVRARCLNSFSGKCQGLTITPYNAGHTLGGTIWKIRSPSSGTIIYAVDLNHTRERHLDGTVILRPSSGGVGVFEPLARPDLLITDAERALVVGSRRKDRDSVFLGNWVAIPFSISTQNLTYVRT